MKILFVVYVERFDTEEGLITRIISARDANEEEAALARPVGDIFVERGRRNSMFINRLLNEYYAKKGITL